MIQKINTKRKGGQDMSTDKNDNNHKGQESDVSEGKKRFDVNKTVNNLEKGVRQATRTKRAVQRLFRLFD